MEDHIPIIISNYIDDFNLKPYKLTIKLHQDILYQKVEDYYLDLQNFLLLLNNFPNVSSLLAELLKIFFYSLLIL